jgi:outer membrane protein insertion porin family/translocation and assembly module TamA
MAVALSFGLAPPPPLAAQDLTCDRGDREVRALRFSGNRAYSDAELANVVATTPSSFVSRLRLGGTRRCLDRDEFPRDLLRLQAFYRKRGYASAEVDTLVAPAGASSAGLVPVEVTFVVREGVPLRIDSLAITGLEAVAARDPQVRERVLRDFPLRVGGVFDVAALESARDSIIRRLRDRGYPSADALIQRESDIERLAASVTLTVVPGPYAELGRITIEVDTSGGRERQIDEAVTRTTMGLEAGDRYSARAIVDAQRALYQTDAYRRVDIRADTVGAAPRTAAGDTTINLVVRLVEGNMYAARVAAGWATLDCFRAQGELADRNFLPFAQRLDLTARISKIGIGRPFDGAPGLCPQAREDSAYSDRVNYYGGFTLRQPALAGLRRVPSLTVYSSQTSEYKAFRRTTAIGGQLTVASELRARFPTTLSYQLELGRTAAEPAIFCAVFNACDDSTRAFLGADRNRRLGAATLSLSRNRTDDPVEPRSGHVTRLTLRHASKLIGSDGTQQFNKAVGDLTWFWPVGDGGVLLAHAQLGLVASGTRLSLREGGRFIPPQERLYAGGPTTVRGFRQNELGPAVYIVNSLDTVVVAGDTLYRASDVNPDPRTVPIGGNSLIVGNVEYQFRSPLFPELLQLALFTDVGEVWNRGADSLRLDFTQLKLTPGAGLRIRSPFGAIRIDLGYNRYDQPAGAAYYNARATNGRAPLYCVSPGNTLPVGGSRATTPGDPPAQAAGLCPATFRPAARSGFFRRLNPSIWIGQAF